MGDGPSITRDWNRVHFVAFGTKPWTREDIVEFVLTVEEMIVREGRRNLDAAAERIRRKQLTLVKDG